MCHLCGGSGLYGRSLKHVAVVVTVLLGHK